MLMNAQELIKKYDIRLAMKWIDGQHVPDGRLYIADGVRAKRNGDFDAIVAAKPEIVSILTAEFEAKRRAEAEREAKIAAIPGLAEIQAARDDVDKWRSEFERSFADVGGLGVRPRPQYDFDALYAKYPRATAYLKADGMALAEHDVKAAAGRKARERIINGEDGSEALADAEAEWAAYCAEHIWD